MQNILMVCMGNICRSPMAEGLFRERLKDLSKPIDIMSAGLSALTGRGAASFAQEIMQEKGIDISAHQAKQLTQEMLLKTDLVLVMESEQQKQIEFNFPGICGRVHRLGKWSSFDIPDPYRRPKLAFEQTFILIEKCLLDWQARLWK